MASSLLNKNKNQVDNAAQQQKQKVDGLQQNIENQTSDPTAAKGAIVGAIVVLLNKFINVEKVANSIISRLIKRTKRSLNNKGRVDVKNGVVVIFYPKFTGDYSSYKREFERKKQNLRSLVKTLKTIIDSLLVTLKVIRAALAVLQIQLKLKKKKLLVTAAASGPDLASPSPSKPIAAQYPIQKELDDQLFKDLEDNINNYILLIILVQSVLKIIQKTLASLKIKVEQLSFNINVDPNFSPTTIPTDDEEQNNSDSTEYSDGKRKYLIKIETTPSGALQAIAYDAFSKLKITQTAPSKTRKADELIEELKQILG